MFSSPVSGQLKSGSVSSAMGTEKGLTQNKESKPLDVLKLVNMKDTQLDSTVPTNKWPENFMVASATLQQRCARGRFYTDRVLKRLEETNHLPSAIRAVEQLESITYSTEFGNVRQIPVSSMNNANMWDAGDPRKFKRFVLYLQGEDKESPKQSDAAYEKFEKTIQKKFSKNNDVTFIRVKHGTVEQINTAIDTIKNQAGKNDEVLLVLDGHGSSKPLEEGVKGKNQYKEGAMVGLFSLHEETDKSTDGVPLKNKSKVSVIMSETYLKKQMKKLAHLRGIIFVNCCSAGAWVAQNDKTNKAHPEESNPFGELYVQR